MLQLSLNAAIVDRNFSKTSKLLITSGFIYIKMTDLILLLPANPQARVHAQNVQKISKCLENLVLVHSVVSMPLSRRTSVTGKNF